MAIRAGFDPVWPTLYSLWPGSAVITERSFSKIMGRAGRRSLLLGRTLSLERVNDLPKVTQHVWYNRDRDPDFLWNLPGAQTSWFLHPLPRTGLLGFGKEQRTKGVRVPPCWHRLLGYLGRDLHPTRGLGPASGHMTSKGPFRAQSRAAFRASQRLSGGANGGRG